MKGNRIVWVDYAKAIGITLVILGHVPVPEDIKWVIYGFHMPLFFVISGYLKSQHCNTSVGQMKKIANSLLVPYMIYASAITLMYCVIKRDMVSVLLPNILTANFSKLVGEFTTICPLWFIVSLATMKLFDVVVKNAPPQVANVAYYFGDSNRGFVFWNTQLFYVKNHHCMYAILLSRLLLEKI